MSRCLLVLAVVALALSARNAPAQAVVGALAPPAPAATADERAISAVLDDFHDAAAKADGPRYFGHFAPAGVFLGTDATERWTVDAFRAWAAPYFKGKSAWAFVPSNRKVVMLDAAHACFDEVVTSAHYGACRGTGAVQRIDMVWRIAQYSLSIPLPNDLAGDIVKQIRRAAVAASRPAERPASRAAAGVTTVYLVRHAEKDLTVDQRDPPLTDVGQKRAAALARALRAVAPSTAFVTEYQRTRQTAGPLRAAGATIRQVRASDIAGVVAAIKQECAGQSVVVVGHSNTVPALCAALGVTAPNGDDVTYDSLLVVRLTPGAAPTLTHLHYGDDVAADAR